MIAKKIKNACKTVRMQILLWTKYRGSIVGKHFHVGKNVTIHGSNLVAGNWVYIGEYSEIAPNVEIGNYTMISSGVVITGSDHNFNVVGQPIRFSGRPESKKTIIEKDVLIGHGVTIMRGVTIGEASIVGAGSVVTKNVPPYTVVAGVPARIIRERFLPAEAALHHLALLQDDMCGKSVGRPT